MQTKARSPLSRFLRLATGPALICAGLVTSLATASHAETIRAASYADPTTRYDHGILGDAIEWGTLTLELSNGVIRRFILPHSLVFEDTAPRLADLDGDGTPEVIVVESSLTQGARLAVYGPGGRITATDHIGRKNRWLAPVGAADFTGDGRLEIAIVVTPHLAGVVQLLAYRDEILAVIASLDGFTNHRIGDTDIVGGIRDCGAKPQMILAQVPWYHRAKSPMMALSLNDGTLVSHSFGVPFTARNIQAAHACIGDPG